MMQQTIQERSPPMSGRRVDDEAGWLVDHDEVFILMHDAQRDGIGLERLIGLARQGLHMDALGAEQARVGGKRALVGPNRPQGDPALDARTRRRLRLGGERTGQESVEPKPCTRGGIDRDLGGSVRREFGLQAGNVFAAGPLAIIVAAQKALSMTSNRIRFNLMRTLACTLLALIALLAAGCASSPEAKDPTIGWSVEKLYADAKDDLSAGRYTAAIKTLEKVESRYPFGRWAQQAQIDIAYSQFKDNERALALAATDRFLKLYPNHPRLDYVYYLRGLINFNEQSGFMTRLGGQDLSERDSDAARAAYDAFREVVTRFPDSEYAADAQARMKYLVNSMAAGELHVARYYYLRGAYVAAANRAQDAIRNYRQAPALEEALYILMSSYDKLGLTDQRDDAKRVLDLSFPNSRFLVTGIDTREVRWWEFWK